MNSNLAEALHVTISANRNEPKVRIMEHKEENKIEWILIKEAAEIADMHIESIRRLCRKNKIECIQLIEGVSTWQVNKQSLLAYLATDESIGGRPPKKEES